MNRVWGWHFGEHLVRTPSDFGAQGQPPTHPELLDDLAARFVSSGWSLKWLHREIMLSQTYRQSSRIREDALLADPTNRLIWRMNPRRLEVEAWRDSILQASGELDLTVGGPSDPVDRLGQARRTVYSTISRGRLHTVLQLYDFPLPTQHTPKRQITTTPVQQLFVLNSPWIEHQAESLASRFEAITDPTEKIAAFYRAALGRDPRPNERDLALPFLNRREDELGHKPWTECAQALLGSNELAYLD